MNLSESDIPGASLSGRLPAQLKLDELRFWLKCRGDACKGLKTKAQLVKRFENIFFGIFNLKQKYLLFAMTHLQ